MYCLDEPSEVDFLADRHGFERFSELTIKLNRCKRQSYCKSESEINEVIDTSYITVMYNQKIYVPSNYGDEEIVQDRIERKVLALNSSSSYLVQYEI